MSVEIRIQEPDFSLDHEWQAMRARLGTDTGAVAAFVGLVRDVEPGDSTTLELEHYPGMTEKSIAEIVDRALARWQLTDVLVVHRVGKLAPADQIVLVAVGSGHRAEAFAGCEFIMDFLKTDAVIWKKQSERWIEATANDIERASNWQKGS
ncbi:MAG: molybdenum cofactor biosynthesis protein MoaE [Gammaproteobacteria bacterium]|nr:molybdenum cofactor biosynthesis protein MoaE [Gammaproteobacteria bacterium]